MAGYWRNELFDERGPSKLDLDRIESSRPVILWDAWGHSLWANSKAFEVASKEKVAEFQALNSQLQPLLSSKEPTSVDSATFLMGSYCRSAGFYNRAIAHFEVLSQRHPERKELHEELGFLYQAIGRNDKAAEEYRIALKE